MNILISGATGFIGSNLTKKLLLDGHSLFCTLLEDELNPFGDEIVKSITISTPNVDKNVSLLKNSNIDGIIHLASFVQSGEHNSSDIEKLVEANIKFGTILLETAVLANIKWFINTGTYWQNYMNATYSPVNLYAATKQAFESIARYYYEKNKLKFCTVRLFDTYGPNDNRPKIFNLWQKIGLTGESLDMSPGEQIIDISYIDDIVDAYIILANHLQKNNPNIPNGAVYALRAKARVSLRDLAAIFEKTTGFKLNINWGSLPYREKEVMVPCESGEVIPEWEPKVSIEEGINRFLKK